MSRNTSTSLGNYFEQFAQTQVKAGRYKNVSEVIRAGLRLLENEESKTIALKKMQFKKELIVELLTILTLKKTLRI